MSKPTVVITCDYSLQYLGGAQVALTRQAEALAREGWRVVVVAPGAAEVFREKRVAGLTAFSPPMRGRIPGVSLPVLQPRQRLTRRMLQLLRDHSATAVLLHSEFALSSATIAAARTLGIPTLHTVHTFFWRAPTALSVLAPIVSRGHRWLTGVRTPHAVQGSSRINNALRSMTLRIAHEADVVLSPSQHQAEALRDAGLNDVRTFSNVLQAVDESSTQPQPGSLRLVWAGRFAPEKRLEVALDAVAMANARLGAGAVQLDVAGGWGPERPGVTYHGRLSTEGVGELIRQADAALLTSAGFDNQPMVALEAFARSTPIVLSDAVLGEEFGEAAITAAAEDARALADTLVELVRTPERIVASGAAARAYAADRGPEAHTRRLCSIIEAIHRG